MKLRVLGLALISYTFVLTYTSFWLFRTKGFACKCACKDDNQASESFNHVKAQFLMSGSLQESSKQQQTSDSGPSSVSDSKLSPSSTPTVVPSKQLELSMTTLTSDSSASSSQNKPLSLVATSAPADPHMRGIIIAGSHRGGTTWVGQLLNLEPLTCYLGEPFHVGHDNPTPPWAPRWYYHIPPNCRQVAESSIEPITELDQLTRNICNGPMYDAVKDYLRWTTSCERPPNDARYGRLVHSYNAREKPLGTFPIVKDPIATFSLEFLYKEWGLKPVIMVRHPAAFIDSLIRPNWGFDFHDFLDQPIVMETLLKPWASEIRDAVSKIFKNKHSEPFPAPDKTDNTEWLVFPGFDFDDESAISIAADIAGGQVTTSAGTNQTGSFTLQQILSVAEQRGFVGFPAVNSQGVVKFRSEPRGNWKRAPGVNLWVRADQYNDMIQTGILVWRCIYGVIAQYKKKFPDWLIVKHEELVTDKVNQMQRILNYAGLPFSDTLRATLLEGGDYHHGPFSWKDYFTREELLHIRHRTADVYFEFYTDKDWLIPVPLFN